MIVCFWRHSEANAFGARAGDFDAMAIRLPQGVEPDVEAVDARLRTSVSLAKLDDLFSVLEQVDAAQPRVGARERRLQFPW